MANYYIAPNNFHGAGTLGNPWGIPDLFNSSTFAIGIALTTLQPGDTLYFRLGNYHITTSLASSSGLVPMLCPANSGTASQPITIRGYGSEIPTFSLEGDCVQPVWGTATSSAVRNYIRFLGLKVAITATHDFGPGELILQPRAFVIGGTSNEIGYCEISGTQITSFDNHEGIFLTWNPADFSPSNSCWIHHCKIYGFTTSHAANLNSAGIKVYTATNLICEDNKIYGNVCGIFDKASPNVPSGNIYRRNWLTGNLVHQFRGNNQMEFDPRTPAKYFIYDSVIDGVINLQQYGHGHEVYNNLIRTTFPSSEGGKVLSIFANGTEQLDQNVIYNNISLGSGSPITGYEDGYKAQITSGPSAQLALMDYNVYDNTPDYYFAAPVTAATMHSRGYETHAIQDTVANIFVDQTSYVLKGVYPTAGRFGDMVGPRSSSPVGPSNVNQPNSVAAILNTARYGPAALPPETPGSLRVHPISSPWTIQTAVNSLLSNQTTCSVHFAIRVNAIGSVVSNLVLKQGSQFVIGGSSAQLAIDLAGLSRTIDYRFTPTIGQTYFIDLSYTPSAGIVYSQAQQVLSVASPGATASASQLWQLGWQAAVSAVDYSINQFAIWHGYALTQADALALRGGALPTTIAAGNLAAYWSLGGPLAATPAIGDAGLNDASGHGNNFTTLSGTPTLATYDTPLVYVPSTLAVAQVAKSGQTAYFYAVNNVASPTPQLITAVNSDPTISVQFGGAGAPRAIQIQGPYWVTATKQLPFVAYQLSCGPVDSIVVQNGGTGYGSPTATATGGGGSGCVLGNPVVVGGVIVSIPVITPGIGYTSPPTINIIGGGGSGASAVPIMGGIQPGDVVTYSADDSWIIAASGPAPAAPSVYTDGTVTNSSGSLEPAIGGYLPFNLPNSQRTMQVGTQMSGQSSSFFTQYNASCNWLVRTADPWTNAVTSTPDGHPLTITGIASSVFTDNSAANFVDGRISPDMTGVWTLIVDDTDTVNPMQYRVVSNDAAGLISPSDFGAPNVSAGTVVNGVSTGRVWQFTVTRAPSATRLDMVLVLQVKKPGATGTYAYTALNEYMFSPIATAAALPGLPARVSQVLPDQTLANWVNTPSGKSIASIRLHSGDGFGLSNVIDADDLLDPDDFTWSQARRTFTVAVTAVRTYALSTSGWPAQFGTISWSSPNIYVSVWNHTTGGSGYPIDSIRINEGGAGYTTATATAVPTNGGSGCVLGTPVISGGAIVSIPVISHGTAYKTPPTITITGNGSGATAYPVAAIAVPSQNWGNLGGNSYCGEIVCAAPHGLIAGQAVSRVAGTNSFTISNGSTATLTSFIPTIGGYVWPTSPTTLAFFNNNGNMNQPTTGIPGGMNNIVGSQAVSLTLTFNMPDLGTKPYDFTGACAGSLPNCDLQLTVTPQLSDACLKVIAGKIRDTMPAGRRVVVEYGNENWNFTFPMFGFTNLTSGLGVFGSAASGGPNNCYAIRAGQVHKIFFDVFNQAGRGAEIVRAFGSQMTSPAVTTAIVTKINAYNASSPPIPIPIDQFKVAPYLSMPVTTGAISTTMAAASLASGNPLSIAYGSLTPWTRTAYLELFRHYLKYNSVYNSPTGVFAKQQAEAGKYVPVAGEGIPELTSYEGALEALVPTGVQTGPDANGKYLRNQLSHDLYYDPELYDCYMAYLQMCQQGGMSLLHSTSHCYPMTGSGAEGAATTFWGLTNWAGQPAGRGDGTGTTTLGCVGPIDGVNPIGTAITNKFWIDDGLSHHVDNASIQMQAFRDWIEAPNPSGAITLQHATASGAGTFKASTTATGSITLRALTKAGSGTFSNASAGAGTVTLHSFTAAGTATFTPSATFGAITLGSLAISGAGTLSPVGSGTVALGSITIASAGTFEGLATSAVTLDMLATAATGDFESSTADGIVLGALAGAGIATALPPHPPTSKSIRWFPGLQRV